MIIYRVASGRGWTSKTTRQLSTVLTTLDHVPNRVNLSTTTTTKYSGNMSSMNASASGDDLEMDSINYNKGKVTPQNVSVDFA